MTKFIVIEISENLRSILSENIRILDIIYYVIKIYERFEKSNTHKLKKDKMSSLHKVMHLKL